MIKALFFCILTLTLSFVYATPEFTAKEAIGYFNKPYLVAKSEILKKGYTFSEKYHEFYEFQKIKGGVKYKCTFIVKNGIVEAISTNEYYGDYSIILRNIQNEGLTFSKGGEIDPSSGETTDFDAAPTTAIPSSMMRFDKAKKITCFLMCPASLKMGTDLFSINYGLYSK